MSTVIVVVAVLVVLTLLGTVSLRIRRGRIRGQGAVSPVVQAPPVRSRKPPEARAAPRPQEPSETSLAEFPADEASSVTSEETSLPSSVIEVPTAREEEPPATPSIGRRMARAVGFLGAPIASLRGRSRVDAATFDELEESLILADVGLDTAKRLLDPLRAGLRAGELSGDPDDLLARLKAGIVELFSGDDRALRRSAETPTVWLFVGVNGVGKTTTIGKLAATASGAGERVVLAAGDTFRAAAGEQLALWAERTGAGIVQGADGADPSSVVFDAIQHAAATGADLVLADTAGRLHTKTNLMEELKKVRRVADRPPGHVSEVLLVLDATTGQNGIAQAREFAAAVDVTGVVLTKLDGTAKGGIVLAIRSMLGLPIKLVGVGEGVSDLLPFDPEEFASALFE